MAWEKKKEWGEQKEREREFEPDTTQNQAGKEFLTQGSIMLCPGIFAPDKGGRKWQESAGIWGPIFCSTGEKGKKKEPNFRRPQNVHMCFFLAEQLPIFSSTPFTVQIESGGPFD